MKSNITIISGLNDYKKKIAKLIADKLEMFYVDVGELMEFNLVNINKAIKSAGKEYVERLEAKAVNTVSTYSNAVITLDVAAFNNPNSFKKLKDSSIIVFLYFAKDIYLQLFKKDKSVNKAIIDLESKIFEDRANYLKQKSDIVVELDTKNQKEIIAKVLDSINNYYM